MAHDVPSTLPSVADMEQPELILMGWRGEVRGKNVKGVVKAADRNVLVLKNHGLLATGRSIPEAVLLADTMEREAEIQLLAMAAGKLDLPSVEGRERSKEYLRSEKMIGRAWAYQLRRLARERPEILDM